MSQPYASEHHQFQKSPHHQRITTPRYDKCGKLVVGSFLGVHGQAPLTATAVDAAGTYTFADRFTPGKQQIFNDWYGEIPAFDYESWELFKPERGVRFITRDCAAQTPDLNTNEGNQIRYYNYKLEVTTTRYNSEDEEWVMVDATFTIRTDPITGVCIYFDYTDSDGGTYNFLVAEDGVAYESGSLEAFSKTPGWTHWSQNLASGGNLPMLPTVLFSYQLRNSVDGVTLEWFSGSSGWQISGFIPANSIIGGPDIDVNEFMKFTMGDPDDLGFGGHGTVDDVIARAVDYMDYVDLTNLSTEYPDVYSATEIQLAIESNSTITPSTTNKRIRFGQRVWVMNSTEDAMVRLLGDAAYPARKILVVEDYGPLMTPQTGNGAAPMAAFDIGLLTGPTSFVTGNPHRIGSGQNIIIQKCLLYVPGDSLVVAKEINRGTYTPYGNGGDETLICPSLSGNIDCMTGFLSPGGYRLIDPRDSIFEFNHIFVWLRDHCDEWLEDSDPTCP